MQKPAIEKTYHSPALDLHLYVTAVHPIEADEAEGIEAGFMVEGCEPGDKDDMAAPGYEFLNDEWQEHGFSPATA